MNPELREKFLTNTDETGRFIVTSKRTGKTYAEEPLIGGERRIWGYVDPTSKRTSGSYGQKYTGAIKPTESLITEENGFENIRVLEPGTSPLFAIDSIDAKYPDA